ncbi:hypothetical protein ACFL6U_04015 [Planctomycetota bacterium]
MVELLLRMETLLLELRTSQLIGAGIPVLLVGLFLWLSGDRYSAAIIGVLGAAVGAVCGLLVSQWFTLDLWWSLAVGAVILAGVSIWLKNVLIIILAILVFAALGGGGYLAVKLDGLAQNLPDPNDPNMMSAIPSFIHMDLSGRQAYMTERSIEDETLSGKIRAHLTDLWQTVEPHLWPLVLATLVGGVGALILIKFIKSVVILVAYSSVGTTATGLGLQAILLGVGISTMSLFSANRWVLPTTFVVLIVIGCISQIRLKRRAASAVVAPKPMED